jgi:hypothetical protein
VKPIYLRGRGVFPVMPAKAGIQSAWHQIFWIPAFAAMTVTDRINSPTAQLIKLYWDIGKLITVRQKKEGWGKSVVKRLSADLRNTFHQLSGFSPRNIWRMRSFYLAWTEEIRKLPQAVAVLNGENLPPPVAEIPWGHNIQLLSKVKDPLTNFLATGGIDEEEADKA